MLLKTQYRFRKFVGVGICVAGLVMVIFSDVHASDRRESNYIFSPQIASYRPTTCFTAIHGEKLLVN